MCYIYIYVYIYPLQKGSPTSGSDPKRLETCLAEIPILLRIRVPKTMQLSWVWGPEPSNVGYMDPLGQARKTEEEAARPRE